MKSVAKTVAIGIATTAVVAVGVKVAVKAHHKAVAEQVRVAKKGEKAVAREAKEIGVAKYACNPAVEDMVNEAVSYQEKRIGMADALTKRLADKNSAAAQSCQKNPSVQEQIQGPQTAFAVAKNGPCSAVDYQTAEKLNQSAREKYFKLENAVSHSQACTDLLKVPVGQTVATGPTQMRTAK